MYIKQSVMKIDRLDYHFCCRADSPSADSPVQGFPTDNGPFFLYRVGDKCQQVENMKVTEEHICIDAPNRGDPQWWRLDRNHTWVPYSVRGITPARIPYHSHCDVEINLCYYERDLPSTDNRTLGIQNTGNWPIGEYALPNVHRSDLDTACPPGFTQRHISLINQQPTFFEMEVIPMSLGPYFLELIGHNFSALNVHYCERDQLDQHSENLLLTTPAMSDEEAAMQWPKGDYCVITTARNNHCPSGLNRHTRPVAELCCRSDNVENPTPVNWPFTEDFFLFGSAKCLPVYNTHVERYLVRLVQTSELRHETEWDILCHYMPLDWVEAETKWPNGEYMLPIGRRGGLKAAVVNTVQYEDSLTRAHVTFNTSQQDDQETNDDGWSAYKCPVTFERARFTFVSKAVEKRTVKLKGQLADKEYQVASVTAMEFCIRENKTEYINDTDEHWPVGDYCVFTLNKECPVGMRATKEIPLKMPRFVLISIDIVDEHGRLIKNRHWHEDARNRVAYFMQCCREDKSIILRLPPSNDGFYLASSSGLCSSIPGTVLDRERVTSYLTSPLSNKQISALSERDMLLYRELVAQREGLIYLCYYHPGKGLYYSPETSPMQLTTTLNMTEHDLDTMAAMCGCAKNAYCMLYKQVECVCKVGYFGDGRHTCRAITPLTDECADLCDSAAVCAERLDSGLRKKKQLLSHTCVCRSGYAGDGFTCRPSCATRECQPFSRCIYNPVRGTTDCECLSGTIASDGRCNLDIYRSLQNEKDLPQTLIHHDHCLSEETQSALLLAHPQRYFYVFVPEQQIIRTCEDMRSHIVVRDSRLTFDQLLSSSPNNPIKLITENQTLIEVYSQNGTLVIDQHLAQQPPIIFTNGEMYLLSAPLKKTPHHPDNYGVFLITVTLSAVFVVALLVALHYGLTRERKCGGFLVLLRRRAIQRRNFWKRQGECVLVDEPDVDE